MKYSGSQAPIQMLIGLKNTSKLPCFAAFGTVVFPIPRKTSAGD